MMKLAGHVASRRAGECMFNFGGTPGGKRPTGRPRRKYNYNTEMGLNKIGCAFMEWIDLAQDRGYWRAFVNMVMKYGFHEMLIHS
jgi:hypothetical protein